MSFSRSFRFSSTAQFEWNLIRRSAADFRLCLYYECVSSVNEVKLLTIESEDSGAVQFVI